MKISLIIPLKDDYESFKEVLNASLKQTLLPNEIIIIDSSKTDKSYKYIYTKIKNNNIKYFKVNNKYPGEARNIGISKSNYDLIAFLDSKTIPDKNWLEIQFNRLKKNQFDVVFGLTKYLYKNKFQQLIRAATFGNIGHITTPGSIVKKEILKNNNYFIEKVRTADDLEWRQRLISKKYNIGYSKNVTLFYNSLPNSIMEIVKRYFIYSFHTAKVNVDSKLKLLYFVILSLIIILFIPRWNQYFPNWNSNHPLFIHNQLKFIILSIIIFIFILVSIQNISFTKKNTLSTFFKIFFIILSTLVVYNWNFFIITSIERSTLYFPHITKIFILLILISSFLIRGIYYPIKRKVNINYIFPFNWINIGFYGMILDITKTPAYIYGALIPKFFLKKNTLLKIQNIVYYPKYGIKSPSYRIRLYSYKSYLEKQNFKVITKELFDEQFYNERIFHTKTNNFKIFYFYILRILDLLFRKKPYIAIIHIETLPFIPFLAELILMLRKIPYIIDIDDAVYYRFSNKNKILLMLDLLKFKLMAKNASGILAGNYFHYDFFTNFNKNVFYFPTLIDFNKYNDFEKYNKHKNFTIVWIGTPSTTHYLKKLIPVINNIKKIRNLDIKLIGADEKKIKNLKYIKIDWNENTEIKEISRCHIGIMPLTNTKWEKGKCAYKILQYMALKLPVIASPVGVNKEIIVDRENGMLANSEDEWYKKIINLIDDKNLSKKISINGYKMVKREFNLENYKEKLYDVLKGTRLL